MYIFLLNFDFGRPKLVGLVGGVPCLGDWGPTPSPLKATTLPSKGYHQALLHHLALLLAREDELLHQQAVKHPKTCPSAMPPFGPLLVSLCAIWVPAGVGCVSLTTQL